MDYVYVEADVTLFQNSYQLNVRRIRRAREGGVCGIGLSAGVQEGY